MSVYFFLRCEQCKEKCDAASNHANSAGGLCDSPEILPEFLVYHAGHPLKCVSEFDESSYEYMEWTLKNMMSLRVKGRRRNEHARR